jgi:hypothetical protein
VHGGSSWSPTPAKGKAQAAESGQPESRSGPDRSVTPVEAVGGRGRDVRLEIGYQRHGLGAVAP